ncbi:hypothetical protein KVR01_010604 [Diaporthe batatas]|uniref:uncharacterized protein n=1 Tax=Diaporthe batatas TaxID=748121 RepID=UPI001D03945F|nr:uncharacterized protein KVR01_010604 [Diaporthe batatas]KAG8159967.1 hypothetical protein KVR01_010604 [Diaporthe batatas]
MPGESKVRVVGVDVGGTNTDAVVLDGDKVIGWHKAPTTRDIHSGVTESVVEALRMANVPASSIMAIKIGTTQFVNAILELDKNKLDKVAVLHGFPRALKSVMEGYYAYLDGGYQIDGREISAVSKDQLRTHAQKVRELGIRAITVVGVYSPSYHKQEEDAAAFLAEELGPAFDISCSHSIGQAGFLERENAAILNASIRRFSRRVVNRLDKATRFLVNAGLYITLNDGTLARASYAAANPLRCFSSGPTNSARGAAFLAQDMASTSIEAGRDLLVIDVGGTTTDVCSLLPNGYPRQSAACVKVAGVKTNFSMPDVHSIALGAGSVIRGQGLRTSVGPDSVALEESTKSLHAGGAVFTAGDLKHLKFDDLRERGISPQTIDTAKSAIQKLIENAVTASKTKVEDATVLLVGGGSFILPDRIEGTDSVVRPPFYQVANAVGAAIGKISSTFDCLIKPGDRKVRDIVADGKQQAIAMCEQAGGNTSDVEIVELETIPEPYAMDGTFRLVVRVVSSIKDITALGRNHTEADDIPSAGDVSLAEPKDLHSTVFSHTDSIEQVTQVDAQEYRPDIKHGYWTVSETDIEFLIAGTGVLGGSPSVFVERLPGGNETKEAMDATLHCAGISNFSHIVPTEIGGINALEALLSGALLEKTVLDADLMGRAFPQVYMTVLGAQGKKLTPAALSDGNGNIVNIQTAKDDWELEDLARAACGSMKSIAGMCITPLVGEESKLFVQNSYSVAWEIGRRMHIARQHKSNVAQAIVEPANGEVLFSGKIHSVSRKVANSLTQGICVIRSEGSSGFVTDGDGTFLELIFTNEFSGAVLKTKDGDAYVDKYLAASPDMICMLDGADGMPIGVTEVRYGLRVDIIAMPAPAVWYTEEGLRRVGPTVFGYVAGL